MHITLLATKLLLASDTTPPDIKEACRINLTCDEKMVAAELEDQEKHMPTCVAL
jgi:hypothetical protein